MRATEALKAGEFMPKLVEAERRLVTVLFCDLVGSTELSERLDPEDLHEVISSYQATCASAILRFDGFVALYVGDGVVAYFGYPRAFEDAAERAIRAGLAIVNAISQLSPKNHVSLSVRVGLSSGITVVGDVLGRGTTEQTAITGRTPNLAARIQAEAKPNTVVISDNTKELLGDLFEFEDLGYRALRGIEKPVRLWRVIRERLDGFRFDPARAADRTTFVGRKPELQGLYSSWKNVIAGKGEVVLISGEAGIGKSRLCGELIEGLKNQPNYVVRLQGSAHHLFTPLYPLIGHILWSAGIREDDPTDVKLDKLEAVMDLSGGRDDAPLVAEMLSIPTHERYPQTGLPAAQRRARLLEILVDRVVKRSERQPVIIFVEDAHWLDPTTQEVIGEIIKNIISSRVLLLITYRPSYRPVWPKLNHVSELYLGPLSKREVENLIIQTTKTNRLPPDTVAEIVERSEGIPLFAEEVAKTLSAQPSNSTIGARTRSSRRAVQPPVPETLHDSLMARLDSAPGLREVAQIASSLGRSAGYELLATISEIPRPTLEQRLAQLVNASVLHLQHDDHEPVYTFKHALVQEVAYQSMLKSSRQKLHARIARKIAERFPAMVDAEPEVVAHHLVQAEEFVESITILLRAAQAGLARSAYVEASNLIRRGLELLPHVEQKTTGAALAVELRISYGAALVALHGYAAAEVEENYRLLREVASEAENDLGNFHALLGLSRAAIVRADMRLASESTGDFLAVAQRLGRPELHLTAELLCGITQFMCAELDASEATLGRVIAAYDPVGHAGLAHRLGQDPGITAMFWSAQNAWLRGDDATATRLRDRALSLARRLDHPFTLTYMLVRIAGLDRLRGDIAAMRTLAEEAHALAGTHAFPAFAAGARFWLADAEAAALGDRETLRRMADEIAAHAPTDQRTNVSHLLACLAERALAFGDLEAAADALDQCATEIEATGVRWCEAELHRLRGLLLARQDRAAEALDCLAQAAALAAAQGARALELRATLDAAQQTDGDGRAAADLERLCARLPAGADMAELAAARRLLENLRGQTE